MPAPPPSPLLSAGPPVWNVARAADLGPITPALGDADAHLGALRSALAAILTGAQGRDVVFVGRSPEPLRAYLGGLLAGVTVPWHVSGLNVSLLHTSLGVSQQVALRPLLALAGLHPQRLLRERRRVALVDVVASGGTFVELSRTLTRWSADLGVPDRSVSRRLQLIGLTRAGGGRPDAWRWAAHPDLRGVPTRSVLTSVDFWTWLAEGGAKVAPRCPAPRWAALPETVPARTPERVVALAQARALYLRGTRRDEREAMIRVMNAAGAQGVPALRLLMLAWRGSSAPVRPSRNGRLPRLRA